jgi:flagellar biosynthesis GTPase FlhF
VVALKEQRITVYGTNGTIMDARVSTGRSGYETPPGVFSILEKRREHYSNLYDDASMPFMQRLTWSGIALHAGVLPGRPASHGCIRMPYGFAGQLFEATRLGMRVVVVPSDIRPADFDHPLLFKPGPIVSEPPIPSVTPSAAQGEAIRLGAELPDAISARSRTWRAHAAEKSAEAEVAAKAAREAKTFAAQAASEAALASRQLRVAQAAAHHAAKRLQAAQRSLETARAKERAEAEKANAAELLTAAERTRESVEAEARTKFATAETARDAAVAADAANTAAQEARKLAEAKLAPVSVLISRKTQRLYVRQASHPIFDEPITIRDPDLPIGTTTFTATRLTGDSGLRWIALAMSRSESRASKGITHPLATDVNAAKAVLDRISIPSDVVARINEVTSSRASLIVSDELMHPRETGKAPTSSW